MRQLVAGLRGQPPLDTPLAKAQALMERAFEERDERRQVQLAKEALAICPDYADAYVLLAEHATSRKEMLRLYEQGVAAGDRSIGPKPFQEEVGHFWGLLETRPYMRARAGLAHTPVDRRASGGGRPALARHAASQPPPQPEGPPPNAPSIPRASGGDVQASPVLKQVKPARNRP
jgi:hypothetical protein